MSQLPSERSPSELSHDLNVKKEDLHTEEHTPTTVQETQRQVISSALATESPLQPQQQSQETSTSIALTPTSRQSRAVDVSSILNPQPTQDQSARSPYDGSAAPSINSRRRSAAQAQLETHPLRPIPSPRYATGSLPRSPTRRQPYMSESPFVGGSQSGTPPHDARGSPSTRHMLIPRSPAARTVSMGASIDGSQRFSPSRGPSYYTADPSQQGIPPMPPRQPIATPESASRPSYGFPQLGPTPIPGRRTSAATTHVPLSRSISPSTPYTQYSQPSHQQSPASHYGIPGGQPTLHGQPGQFQPLAGGFPGSDTPYYPLTQEEKELRNAQNRARLDQHEFYLPTAQGGVFIGVDKEKGSKASNEKRARNAGASARFRNRQKAKFQDKDKIIAKQEQDIKEGREDIEWYRRDRDWYRSELSRATGIHRHDRPSSPPQRASEGRIVFSSEEPEISTAAQSPASGPSSYDVPTSRRGSSRTPRDQISASQYQLPPTDNRPPTVPPPTGYAYHTAAGPQNNNNNQQLRHVSGPQGDSTPRYAGPVSYETPEERHRRLEWEQNEYYSRSGHPGGPQSGPPPPGPPPSR
jgi:hypothetical protein